VNQQAFKSDARATSWLAVCTDVLNLAEWLSTGDYEACVLRSVAGRAVLGAHSGDEELTLNTLESYTSLLPLLRRRVARYVLTGGDDDTVDGFVDPDVGGPNGNCNPATYRATAVLFVAAASLSFFVQVRDCGCGCRRHVYVQAPDLTVAVG
jgi:hypothetical protein